jgi:hypothetical protein
LNWKSGRGIVKQHAEELSFGGVMPVINERSNAYPGVFG